MRLASLTMALLALLAGAGIALGHTSVAATSPADGASLATAPKALIVTLSSPPARLDSASVRLAGREVSGFPRLDPEDARLLVVPIESRAPGRYMGEWTVVSADGHPITGRSTFTVTAARSPLIDELADLGELMSGVGRELARIGTGSGER